MARRLGHRISRISRRQLFTWLMIGSLVCILLPRRFTSGLDNVLAKITSPASRPARDLTLSVTRTIDENRQENVSAKQYQELENKYQRTVNRLINISQELRNARKMAEKMSYLRQRFGLERAEFILADIAGNDSSNKRQQIYLAEGSDNHIKPGQIVLAMVDDQRTGGDAQDPANDIYQMSVVGQVDSSVGSDNSRAQLITDPGFRMPVVVQPRWDRQGQNFQADGIMLGRGTNPIQVMRVESRYPVKVGDVVLAQPGDRTLAVSMAVGLVKTCRRDDKEVLFWNITVEPMVDLDRMSKVIVIANPGR